MTKKPPTNLAAILRELILSGKAKTQQSILAHFANMGYKLNQPKISRLLHKIGAIKVVSSEGKSIYRLPHQHKLAHELTTACNDKSIHNLVLEISHNETLLIIHTLPGAAALIARLIDQQQFASKILGTIAGDDTIIVVPQTVKNIAKIKLQLENLFNS